MAIKITDNGQVKVLKPFSSYFNLQDLENEVGGFIEPIKIGPVWIIFNENSKEKMALNQVASFFFDVAMHGDVLVIPPQQLPPDWDIMDEIDYKYTGEQVDEGFLISLQKSLINSANGINMFHNPFGVFSTGKTTFAMSEEYTFEPPVDLTSEDENTRDFYKQVCETQFDAKRFKRDGVLLDDNGVVIKVKKHQDKLKCIDQMISLFLEEEEYEKCAELRDAKNQLEDVDI